jgi:hypothetical protein
MPIAWLCATFPKEVVSIGTTIVLCGFVAIYYVFGMVPFLTAVAIFVAFGFWLEGRKSVPMPPEMFDEPVLEPLDEPPPFPALTAVEQRFLQQQRRYAALTSPPLEISPVSSDRTGNAVRQPPVRHRW